MYSSSRPTSSDQQPQSMELGKYENKRLNKVMGMVELHSKNPDNGVIRVDLKILLQKLFGKLNQYEIPAENAFLVGGGASYVLNPRCSYSDIDISIPVSLSNTYKSARTIFAFIMKAVLELIQELSHGVRDPMSYLQKAIRIEQNVRTNYWSLFALRNEEGRHVELKFVLSIPREFIFFSDSIEIDLTNFAKKNCVTKEKKSEKENHVPIAIGSNQKAEDAEPTGSDDEKKEYLPSRISSSYKDLRKAVSDVKSRRIDTVEPNMIRGGGFLKYAHLKTKGFVDSRDGQDLEKLLEGMVSGFLSEFNESKYDVLSQYMRNHFDTHHFPKKFKFLDELRSLCCHLEKFNIKDAMETRIERIHEEELGKMAILRATNRHAIVMPLLDADDGFDYSSDAAHPFFPYLYAINWKFPFFLF
ncbi:hypothetical protein L3Y34_012876 [Caenorhabditis briggsae]|uniref:polynucleotide adenylyltransferase n=1 Tax=Caenorhabditis briggsae TaxID=6238 RepID=A0AAE9CW10_CAEBR|nr:hypothetical protein L3Y34_012876 [Caenorhabditis briggsae]